MDQIEHLHNYSAREIEKLHNRNRQCDMLHLGKQFRFTRTVGKRKISGMGEILFLSYNKVKGEEYPITHWCRHVNRNCVLWVKSNKNGRTYRVNEPNVRRRSGPSSCCG